MSEEKEKRPQVTKNKAAAKRPHIIPKRRSSTVILPDAKYDGAYGKENKYYTAIADRYRICKYITILLTVVFAVTMLTCFSQDITAENFQYLIKDLDLSGLTFDSDFESLVFSGGADSAFGVYRSELVVVGQGTTSLYRSSGSLSLHKSNSFYDPQLLVSEKYFLIYDRAESSQSYTVYNSFAELHSEQLDYPITGAALSDQGTYAIVTRDDSFRSIVRVYDRDFHLKNEIKKDKYVLSVALTDDGKTLAIASVYDEDGGFVTELMTVPVGGTEASMTLTVEGVIPLSLTWQEKGNLAVLYTDRTVIYTPSGKEVAQIDYMSQTSLHVRLGKELICVTYNTTVLGYDKTVEIYDQNGSLLYTGSFTGELITALCREGEAALLLDDRLIVIDPYTARVKETEVEPNAIALVYAGEIPVVCYSGSAYAPSFATE